VSIRRDMHVVLNDQHIPYHDKTIRRLSLDFVREHKPGTIHLLGDVIDFYSISRYSKDPTRKTDLQSDLDDTVAYFNDLREASPDSKIEYSEGNHEYRLKAYLQGTAPELDCLRCLHLAELLRFNEYKINYHGAHKPYWVGHLLFTHGNIARKHSGQSAMAHHDRYGGNVIHGHTHRAGSFFHTVFGDTYGAWESPCQCDADPEYCIKPNWQQGWSVVWFRGSRFSVEQVIVVKKAYTYHGEFYGTHVAKAPAGKGTANSVSGKAAPVQNAARKIRGHNASAKRKAAVLPHPNKQRQASVSNRKGVSAAARVGPRAKVGSRG
jgi:UDP-2,3-diacylglucosamine pyrophosphatase LpxH